MKRKLTVFAICLAVAAIMVGCMTGTDHRATPDQLREEDFERIEARCMQYAEEKKGEFARTLAQFFFSGGYMKDDYSVKDVELVRHVYSFENKDGEYCLALPFSVDYRCSKEAGTATVWNMIILIEPELRDGELKIQDDQLRGNFTAFYSDQAHDSVLDALEDTFVRIYPDAQLFELD